MCVSENSGIKVVNESNNSGNEAKVGVCNNNFKDKIRVKTRLGYSILRWRLRVRNFKFFLCL